jgi:DNA-nicking Smr family endonuclease
MMTWQQQQLQQRDGGGASSSGQASSQGSGGGGSSTALPTNQQMLSGDWICKCGEHNFARRTRCWKCRGRNSGNAVTVVGPSEGNRKGGKPGDWTCVKCNADNFARRKQCYQCSAPKPAEGVAQGSGGAGAGGSGSAGGGGEEGAASSWDMKKACDWTCGNCSARNFKRNVRCFQCHSARATPDGGEAGGGGGAGGRAGGAGRNGGSASSGPATSTGSGSYSSGGNQSVATPEQERKAVETLAQMLRKCKHSEQVVSVLVQHFAEAYPALKSMVLPRAAVGGPRKWFLRHSDVFQLGAPDNYGQSIVRLKQMPSSATGGANANANADASGASGGGGGSGGGGSGAAAGAASESEEREAVKILTQMLRKCGGQQVVSVLVQHFSMQHPALKNVVLPRGIEGNSRRWIAKHSDVFQLGALDKDGQSVVRIQEGADAIIASRAAKAGKKPPEAVEREAVDVLVGMLRTLGGDQVISVLVQYFSMEHPELKNDVMPRGMAGGPRRWFQEHADIFAVGQPDRDGQTRVGLQSHLLNKPGCD